MGAWKRVVTEMMVMENRTHDAVDRSFYFNPHRLLHDVGTGNRKITVNGGKRKLELEIAA
ncbi:MAG TPA: hypothetical protein ENK89_00560 [Desulfobulbaceae bacterium]|nr:hypothetical protein [Desulfobulbaceae bacterium]